MAEDFEIEAEEYSVLKDFSIDVEVRDDDEYESFFLCFWVYLLNSSTFPCTIIRQVDTFMSASVPLLVLDEHKKLILLPLTLLHKDSPEPDDTSSCKQAPNASTRSSFPLEKWVHVGCEVSRDYIRLFIDGENVSETSLPTSHKEFPRKIKLFSDGISAKGFIRYAQVLPPNGLVKHHFTKDPSLWLSVDKPSSSSGFELDDDGVWKVSCNESFSLDVVLSNSISHKDAEVIASLLYVDDETRVEENESEPPLLISYDGAEFFVPKPIKLLNGRSSFKLKISQLSSKNDDRLFCIKFEIPNAKDYPFLQARTKPIRCVSFKRARFEEDNSSTDSENSVVTISDSTIFRYCLGNLTGRSLLLKEITNNSSDDEVSDFANQVSLYSGCSHHRYQINMARELIAEGTNVWILISRNNQTVRWDNAVNEIEQHFMRISKCSSRSLTSQDFDLLKRISGCYYEYLTQENFEKLWCWLFPVASSISRGLIHGMWRSKWVEGFVTKEEAEYSLKGQEPGTFVIRFPVSRSWPHPDAGCLVVSYVGFDSVLRHKQLNIDNICERSERYMDSKPLQDMLLAEPELSRLGRIIRSQC